MQAEHVLPREALWCQSVEPPSPAGFDVHNQRTRRDGGFHLGQLKRPSWAGRSLALEATTIKIARYWTISIFSSRLIPSRVASLPFTVMVLAAYSASLSLAGLCSPISR